MNIPIAALWMLGILVQYVHSGVPPQHATDKNSNIPAVAVVRTVKENSNQPGESFQRNYETHHSTNGGHLEIYIPQLSSILRGNYSKSSNNLPNSQRSIQNNQGPVSNTHRNKEYVGLSNFNFPNPLLVHRNNNYKENVKSSIRPYQESQISETSTKNARNENNKLGSIEYQNQRSQDSKYHISGIPENTNIQQSLTLERENYQNNRNIHSASRVLNSKNVQKVPLVLITIQKEHHVPHENNSTTKFYIKKAVDSNVNNEPLNNFPNFVTTSSRDIGQPKYNVPTQTLRTHHHQVLTQTNSGHTGQQIPKTEVKNSQAENDERFRYSLPMSRNQDTQTNSGHTGQQIPQTEVKSSQADDERFRYSLPMSRNQDTQTNSGHTGQQIPQTEVKSSQAGNDGRLRYSLPMSRNQDTQPSFWKPMGLKSYKVSEGLNQEMNYKYKDLNHTSYPMPHYMLSSDRNSYPTPSHSLLHVPELVHAQNPSNIHSLLSNNYHKQRTQTDLAQNSSMLTNFNGKVMVPLVYRSIYENFNLTNAQPTNSKNEYKMFPVSNNQGKTPDSIFSSNPAIRVQNVIFPSEFEQNKAQDIVHNENSKITRFIENNSNYQTFEELPVIYGKAKNFQVDDRTSAFSENNSQKNLNEAVAPGNEHSNFKIPSRYIQSHQDNGNIQEHQSRSAYQGQSHSFLGSNNLKNDQMQQMVTTLTEQKPIDLYNVRNNGYESQSKIVSKPHKKPNLTLITRQNDEDIKTYSSESRNFARNQDYNNEYINLFTNPGDQNVKQDQTIQPIGEVVNKPVNYYDGYVIFPQKNNLNYNNEHLNVMYRNFGNIATIFSPVNNLETHRGVDNIYPSVRNINYSDYNQREKNPEVGQVDSTRFQGPSSNIRTVNEEDNTKNKVFHSDVIKDDMPTNIYPSGNNYFQFLNPQKSSDIQEIPTSGNSNNPLNYVLNVGKDTYYDQSESQRDLRDGNPNTESSRNLDLTQFVQIQNPGSSSGSSTDNDKPSFNYNNNNFPNSGQNLHVAYDAPNPYYETIDQTKKYNGGHSNNVYSNVPAETSSDTKEQKQENQQNPTAPLLLVLVTSKKTHVQNGSYSQGVANPNLPRESSSEEIVRFLSQESNTKKLLESFYKETNGNTENNGR